MSGSLTSVAYIGATILFILSLGGLSNPETSRRGNLYGMIGMTIAQSAIHLTASSMGSAVALSIALVICMSWNLGILWLKRAR